MVETHLFHTHRTRKPETLTTKKIPARKQSMPEVRFTASPGQYELGTRMLSSAGKAHFELAKKKTTMSFEGAARPQLDSGVADIKDARFNKQVPIEERKWWKEGVVYQIYPKSFYDTDGDGIGDIKGIIKKLDHLKDLGVDIIWLNPVYKSPDDDNGYDISDYQAIQKELGTMKDWDLLVSEMHKRGMKLVMDLVVNHTSDEHKWFVESKQSKDNPKRDFYIWAPPAADGGPPTNWMSAFGGPAWEFDDKTGEYYLHLFSKKQPDLNWKNPQVRQEVYDMMNWWLDKGADGFRMDVINFINKKDEIKDVANPYDQTSMIKGPHLNTYLKEMHQKALAGRDIMTVGECPGITLEEARKVVGKDSKELNMVFNFDHVGLDSDENGKWTTKRTELNDLKEVINKWQKGLEDSGWNSIYLMNHDQPRAVSRFGNDAPEFRKPSAKMLATMVMTLQGTPYVYMGEEIGMTNIKFDSIKDYRDIETLNYYKEAKAKGMAEKDILQRIHAKSRDNSRTPMQWNNEKNAGFSKGTPWIKVNPNYTQINVEKAKNDPDSIYHYMKELIKLRKESPVLVYGKFDMLADDDPNIFAYTRTLGKEKMLVVLNFSDKANQLDLPSNVDMSKATMVMDNYKNSNAIAGSQLELKPYEARVYRL
jgi:oligo-1,6-glucosidase